MLNSLASLLVCQLAGEIVSRAFGLPVPGPVMGLVFLCVVLLAMRNRVQVPDSFNTFTDGLLARMGILFVPAGVGTVQQMGLLGTYWVQIGVTLVISTLLTLVITVGTFIGVKALMGARA